MNIIGEVKDRTCVIMDDIVDTAGTLCKVVRRQGAGCEARVRLLHASRAVGRGGEQDWRFGARRVGRHRHHSAA